MWILATKIYCYPGYNREAASIQRHNLRCSLSSWPSPFWYSMNKKFHFDAYCFILTHLNSLYNLCGNTKKAIVLTSQSQKGKQNSFGFLIKKNQARKQGFEKFEHLQYIWNKIDCILNEIYSNLMSIFMHWVLHKNSNIVTFSLLKKALKSPNFVYIPFKSLKQFFLCSSTSKFV